MAICDRSKEVVHWAESLPSAKMGLYADGRLYFKAAVHEKWLNRGREDSRQKRDTLERMSLPAITYSAQ